MRWARCLLLAALWMLLAAWLMPVRAQAAQNNYYYPGYDAASNGDVDLMRYMKQITMTVNGQEYTSAELKELKDAGTPLQMKVGDTASFNFSFSLCGRAYDPNDPTSLDAGASTHATYTHGTTYLNGESVAAGQDGILDDSSLMVDNQSADSSFLRLDIGWLLDFCPEGISINYSEGGVSFQQRDRYLYIYFPNGIGQDTYADPGYFSIGVTVGETLDEIRIPGTDGFYVPGTDDWVFPVVIVKTTTNMSGAINTYGDILVKKVWQTGGQPHLDATIILYYTENGQEKKATGGVSFAVLQAINADAAAWLEMPGLELSLPVVQAQDNQTYLHTAFDGSDSPEGCLFFAAPVDGETELYRVIYGHNLHTGSMFSGLLRYREQDFYTQYPTFTLYTPEEAQTWRIFSCHEATDTGEIYRTGRTEGEEYDAFLQQLLAGSDYDTGAAPPSGAQVLTLSTCATSYGSGLERYVVHAYRES